MLYKRTQHVRSSPQTAEFSPKTLTQFLSIPWGIIRQAGIFDVRPDLFIGVEFRRISRKPFGNNLRMFGQIRPNHLRAIMNPAVIPDNRNRAGKMTLKLTQKAHHIFGMNAFVVRQKDKVQSLTFANGAEGDGTDGRDSVASIPAIVNGCLTTRGQGSTNGRAEHETRFIWKNQVRSPTSSVFLYAETPVAATAGFLCRCVPGHVFGVSDWSNPTVSSGYCGRVPDEVLSRNAGGSPGLLARPSISCWASRVLEHLATEVFPTAEVAHRPAVSFDREAAWQTSLAALRVPYPANDKGTDALHRVFGRLVSATRPLVLVAPLADDGVPDLLRFLLVSYIRYRNICLRHLRKTGINSIAFVYVFRIKWGAFPTTVFVISFLVNLLLIFKLNQFILKTCRRIKKKIVVIGQGNIDDVMIGKADIEKIEINKIEELTNYTDIDEIIVCDIPKERDMGFINYLAQKLKAEVVFDPVCYAKLLPERINGNNTVHSLATFVGRKQDIDEFLIRSLDVAGSLAIL